MKKRGLSFWKQLLLGFFLILTVLAFSLLWVVDLASQPYRFARVQAVSLAKNYTDLKNVTSFSVFNRRVTYYSIQGTDSEQDGLLILVPEKGGTILTYQQDEGIGQDEAVSIAKAEGAHQVKAVTFGLINRQPVWEVSTGKTYYYIGFKKGNLVSKEGL